MRFYHAIPAGLVIAVLVSSLSFSIPSFTAKNQQKCNLCHVSPTGGGMRNEFGSQFFAMTELAAHQTDFDAIEKFQTKVSDIISLGADMRTLFNYNEQTERSSFFQMEGNLYLSAQLNEEFSLTLSKDLDDDFEIYGMGYILPMQGYFRVGKFQPAYGWRFADHTSFVREKMLWPANSTDTGFELGFYPQGFSINLGMFNGTGSTFDNNDGKALASRIEYRRDIGGVGIGIGGSYWLNNNEAGNLRMFGPFGYLHFFDGRLLYLGEIDWLEDEALDPTPIREATSHKLSYMLSRGIWLKTTYDYYDPDIDLKTGRINRYGVGFEYFPYGFLEVQPNLWYYQDDFSADDKYLYFNTQFHFFF